MTYTIRPCRSYPMATSLVVQEFEPDGRIYVEAPFCGFQGTNRVKKAVKRAMQELLWDERQGFKENEVFVQGKGAT